MYRNFMFPKTPDSFAEKVRQTVQENMKEDRRITEDRIMGSRENNRRKWKKSAVAAALAVLVVGAGSFTVHAVVRSMALTRMESMPEEEKTELVKEADTSTAEASTYSRELTQEEKERQRELARAYQKDGLFPEGELKRIADESEVDEDVLCFLPETSYFYLPDRDLTDEELLQIIDYRNKTDYALRERYQAEYSEEIAAREAQQAETQQRIQSEGGITEEDAKAKAQEWLGILYGKSGEDMDVYCNIDTDVYGTEESPAYMIGYTAEGLESYMFSVDAADGTLSGMIYTGAELDVDEMSVADAEDKVKTLGIQAEKYLRDSFGISGECKEVYYSYTKNDSGNTIKMNMMTFRFVMEDEMTYAITLDCPSGVPEAYRVQSYDTYQEALEEDKELRDKGVITQEAVRKQLN